ncbi:MAG: amidohydrolase [Thermosediminibacteraceae bacterium]|nr:amidohydrolase [Thermosediminibacteraceae bacterium]
MLSIDVLEEVKKVENDIINWRRELHKIPEVGFDLPKTVDFVKMRLEEMGIEYKVLVNGSAVVGLIRGAHPGRTIALRADMDALPIKEETGLPFASINENMHACGHDAHTAILLGVAKVLNKYKDFLKGNVKLLFQPAEEGPGGAKPMIEEGALEDPKVDGVLGLHVGNISDELKPGSIGYSYSNLMACLDRFKIKVVGKGAHGAYPELSVDPVVIASQLVVNLQQIVSREISPSTPAVVTIGKIHGGTAYNIIPDAVELEGTVRAIDQNVREYIAMRIEEIARGITSGMRAKCEYEYVFGYPPLVNNEEFTREFVKSAKKILKEDQIIEIKKPLMGGEDMAYFLQKVPGTFFFLCNPMEIDGEVHPHHNSKFAIDEKHLKTGAAVLLQATVDLLENN